MGFDEVDPRFMLVTARAGTAYFAQRLAGLDDAELDADTLLAGWTRRHVIAHVAHNAAALSRLLDWAATGLETPMYESAEQRGREIDDGARLGGEELRNMFATNSARLDEKWRRLEPSAWDAVVRTVQGRMVPASETVWMRVREVWIHAVDLDNGGRFEDLPAVVLDPLLADIVGMWRTKNRGDGVVLVVDGRDAIAIQEDSRPVHTVGGPLAAVVRWASGRGAVGLDLDPAVPAPPWL